jgi:protein ImuB
MGRFAAIALVNLRIELAEQAVLPPPVTASSSGAPSASQSKERGPSRSPVLAVVIARPSGSVKDETSLLGNTCLEEVSAEAFALGIRPGQTVASARARSSELRVRVVPLESVEKTLAGVAEMALAFGPTTAFEMGGFAGDVVWVDVTGCGHLHGADDSGGERELLLRLQAKVEALGHRCRVAIADGPQVAAAVARFAPMGQRERERERERGAPRVVPAHANREALAKLPLAALGLEAKTFAWMSALGLRHVSDLQTLPRRSLGTRLGGDAARVMALLEGEDPMPLVAYVPPEIPTEEVDLEYGIESAEALLFVAKRLAGRLAARLEGRVQKAMRLELVLRFELKKPSQTLEVVLASPLAKESELFAVLKTKIEAQDRVTGGVPFAAPIASVKLRATTRAEALDLLVPEAKADRALPKLASELMAELGPERVGTLALTNSWVLEDRSRLLPYGVKRSQEPLSAFLSGSAEPTRLIPPELVKRTSLVHSRLVARFEAIEWWHRGRDRFEHYASWLETKRAMAFIELEGESAMLRGYLD